jgi:16S rRNA (cytidine(1402)-2'-O)-methyltransferase
VTKAFDFRHSTFDSLPVLYLVATPIGNLGDITLRALETLRTVDIIAAEDTRHSQILLRHHGITGKSLVSFHEHNEAQRTAEFIERLKAGCTIAVITDAGLPGISDPGARLVRACQREILPFTIVPGSTTNAWNNSCLASFASVVSGDNTTHTRPLTTPPLTIRRISRSVAHP